MRLHVHEVIEWQFLSKFQIAKACVLCFALVWNPCCGSCRRQLTCSVAIWLTSPTIEWLDSYCGSCNWWDVLCVCGAFGICFVFVAEFETMCLCVIPTSCSNVCIAFVAFGKWLCMHWVGICVSIALACFCSTNGFISSDNGGDGVDRNSTTFLCLKKLLKGFGCGILVYFLVVMQLFPSSNQNAVRWIKTVMHKKMYLRRNIGVLIE